MPSDAGQNGRTIYLEATSTANSDINTGIQRVVRNLAKNAPEVAAGIGIDVDLVIFDSVSLNRSNLSSLIEPAKQGDVNGIGLMALPHKLYKKLLWFISLLLPSKQARHFVRAPSSRVGLSWLFLFPFRKVRQHFHRLSAEGATLVLVDASWEHPAIWAQVKDFKQRGGRVVGIVYDVIPMTHPDLCADKLTAAFRQWLFSLLDVADGIVCISAFSARCLQDIIDERTQTGVLAHAPMVSHFYLGAELDLLRSDESPTTAVQEIFSRDNPVFLVVGSIDPRKNHGFILDAFERFWQDEGQATLLIIGAHGWKNEGFLDRVANHPKTDKELFLLRSANDADLNFAYKNASALVFASQIEGFGLPIVEAFQHGLPVICSDIPVFREIADGKATFFDLSDPAHLESAIAEHCRTHSMTDNADRAPQPYLSWKESTQQFFGEIEKMSKPAEHSYTIA
ncbi:MAG: glycosyltransferase family 4 protein [Hyphomicrobiaceae bacterium]